MDSHTEILIRLAATAPAMPEAFDIDEPRPERPIAPVEPKWVERADTTAEQAKTDEYRLWAAGRKSADEVADPDVTHVIAAKRAHKEACDEFKIASAVREANRLAAWHWFWAARMLATAPEQVRAGAGVADAHDADE